MTRSQSQTAAQTSAANLEAGSHHVPHNGFGFSDGQALTYAVGVTASYLPTSSQAELFVVC